MNNGFDDFHSLVLLTEGDLEILRINKQGHKKKLMKAVENLKQELSNMTGIGISCTTQNFTTNSLQKKIKKDNGNDGNSNQNSTISINNFGEQNNASVSKSLR